MKVFLNWSGGKDSAFCLYQARKRNIPVSALVTTMNSEANRISMHGVCRELLEQQAASVQLPLYTVELPGEADMSSYEQAIGRSNSVLKDKGFTHVASGDLFLEDLKQYREKLYLGDGLDCIFPIWKMDTRELLQQFIALGFKALLVCVNTAFLDQSFCGRMIDESFVRDLPDSVDPCGENGEYHSFVFDGPLFQRPIAFQKTGLVYREYPSPLVNNEKNGQRSAAGFYFCGLQPC